MTRRYSDEDPDDFQDRVTDEAIQNDVDDQVEAKRNASGISPEILSMQQALIEGQRAGQLSSSPSLNPYQDGTPEHAEWERGRSCVIGARLNSQRKVA